MIPFGLRNGEIMDRLAPRPQCRAVLQHDRLVKTPGPGHDTNAKDVAKQQRNFVPLLEPDFGLHKGPALDLNTPRREQGDFISNEFSTGGRWHFCRRPFLQLEGTMELRRDTAKRYPHTKYQSLAERMRELRELRKLVRSAEAKKPNGRRHRLTGRGLCKPH